jgi:hypothetical protein
MPEAERVRAQIVCYQKFRDETVPGLSSIP